MQVDVEMEGELDRVLVLVARTNELLESPEPHHSGLGCLECLELSRSQHFPLGRSAVTITLWSGPSSR